MKRLLRFLLPLLVLAIGALLAFALYANRPEPQTRIPEAALPLIRTQRVVLEDLQLSVRSQGTVSPRTETVLVPEVSGMVIEVSPSFVAGGFFEAGATLLRIDPQDYREAVIQARARVAQAELALARQQAEADLAREEWDDLGEGEPSALTLYEPQLADAAAALEAARSALQRAERDLDRTTVRAPFAGRIRAKQADLGQFVNRGAPLATIYAVDRAEIQLPLPDAELEFIDLPLNYRGEAARPGPDVILRADFAGKTHQWRGRIVRTEGEIDRRSRMITAVAEVEDPYGRGSDPERPPLAAGMFVEAEILGRQVKQVAVIPRTAVREGSQVLLVDDQDRLRFRDVQILRTTREDVIVSSGLEAGDRLCLTVLEAVTDGMLVRTLEQANAGEAS